MRARNKRGQRRGRPAAGGRAHKKVAEVIADIMSGFGFVTRIAVDNEIKLGELEELLRATYARAVQIESRQPRLPGVKP